MKVLLISDRHTSGGAGIAAARLVEALRSHKHDVHWASARTNGTDLGLHRYTDGPLMRYAMQRMAQGVSTALGDAVETRNRVARIRAIVRELNPDVINFHNIHDAGLPATLPAELSLVKPVVWTLHDMWAFTGGCAYSYECEGYKQTCHAHCPYAREIPVFKPAEAHANLQARRHAVGRAGRMTVVTPSSWLTQQAGHGIFRSLRIETIGYSLDLNVFRPVEKDAARAALGIQNNNPVLLTVGVNARQGRKGLPMMIQALGRLGERNLTWVSVGDPGQIDLPPNVQSVKLPRMSDGRLLTLAYSAADCHVLPSLADNLPNVLLEAAACGTPSVAFDVGGIPDAVKNNTTGVLVRDIKPAALANGIGKILRLPPSDAQELRRQARAFAMNHFHHDRQAQAYESLFARIMHVDQRIAG